MKASLFVLTIFLVFSCGSPDNEIIMIDLENLNGEEITLSEIADEITYIPLDNSITIGMINSFYNPIVIGNSVYLYDHETGIMVFNRIGELQGIIGTMGRGPGEYMRGNKFAVDENTGRVYVCDAGNIIKIYSGSGSFQRSISLQSYGGSVDAIGLIDSKLFVTYYMQYGDAEFEWVLVDSTGNLLMNKRRTDDFFSSNYLAGGGTYIVGSKLNYWSNFIDTVFSISDDLTINPEFIIKPGDYRLPRSRVEDPLSQLSDYVTIDQVFETRSYITIRYSFYRGKNGCVLVDRYNHDTYLSYWERNGSGGIENDLDGGTKFLPKGYFEENGREYLVGLVEPVTLKTRIAGSEFRDIIPKCPEKKEELERLADNLKDTDNPILVLVRLN